MRTTLNLDEKIVYEIMQLTGKKNRSEAIRIALHEYIAQQQRQKVLALRGEVSLSESWQALRKIDEN